MSAQGVNERMINVHYYYDFFLFFVAKRHSGFRVHPRGICQVPEVSIQLLHALRCGEGGVSGQAPPQDGCWGGPSLRQTAHSPGPEGEDATSGRADVFLRQKCPSKCTRGFVAILQFTVVLSVTVCGVGLLLFTFKCIKTDHVFQWAKNPVSVFFFFLYQSV